MNMQQMPPYGAPMPHNHQYGMYYPYYQQNQYYAHPQQGRFMHPGYEQMGGQMGGQMAGQDYGKNNSTQQPQQQHSLFGMGSNQQQSYQDPSAVGQHGGKDHSKKGGYHNQHHNQQALPNSFPSHGQQPQYRGQHQHQYSYPGGWNQPQ
eukprot:GFYU01003542.1.p2 GENE.GFYU01003542.1~~GFYU01003542.1.p2  ORF type:complete len:149 (-),score=50.42 GFYU01003542.1:1672-2118(-)